MLISVSCGQDNESKKASNINSPKFKYAKPSELVKIKEKYVESKSSIYKNNDQILDNDSKYIYGANTEKGDWKYYRTKIRENGKKEYFASILAKYDLKLETVINGKMYVAAVLLRKDSKERYMLYKLDPDNKSKEVIFSSISAEMPDVFSCGNKIITKIMLPEKDGIQKERIILIEPDTGKKEILLENSFKSSDGHKVEGKILLGMDYHRKCDKSGFLYSTSTFKDTTLEGKSYGNTIYYFSIKSKKSVKLFDVKYPVSCVSGNKNFLTVYSEQYAEDGVNIYVRINGKYKNLKKLQDAEANSCEKINGELYTITDGMSLWIFDTKNYRYTELRKPNNLIGRFVKDSKVLLVGLKKGKLCFTEFVVKP